MPKHDELTPGRPLKAGIAVDDWKLSVFERRLTEAGYTYENAGKPTRGTVLLKVETTDMLALKLVLEACQRECSLLKKDS